MRNCFLSFELQVNKCCVTKLARIIFMSFSGLSFWVVGVLPILWMIFIPLWTLPKIVCFPSSHGVGARVIKNWDPFEFGPEFAIHKIPAPVCFNAGVISSSNFPPNILSPPRPVPVGSPPWIICVLIQPSQYWAQWLPKLSYLLTKSRITRWNIISL